MFLGFWHILVFFAILIYITTSNITKFEMGKYIDFVIDYNEDPLTKMVYDYTFVITSPLNRANR
jgi:hypothetical protein